MITYVIYPTDGSVACSEVLFGLGKQMTYPNLTGTVSHLLHSILHSKNVIVNK